METPFLLSFLTTEKQGTYQAPIKSTKQKNSTTLGSVRGSSVVHVPQILPYAADARHNWTQSQPGSILKWFFPWEVSTVLSTYLITEQVITRSLSHNGLTRQRGIDGIQSVVWHLLMVTCVKVMITLQTLSFWDKTLVVLIGKELFHFKPQLLFQR